MTTPYLKHLAGMSIAVECDVGAAHDITRVDQYRSVAIIIPDYALENECNFHILFKHK